MIFYTHQCDSVAAHMAAFTAKDSTDRKAFDAQWLRVLANPKSIKKTITIGDQAVGHIIAFQMEPDSVELDVTYWIDRAHWGKGVATAALTRFVGDHVKSRPLHARVAKDNIPSLRVLQKCGFEIVGEAKFFANARSKDIEEYVLTLVS